jgi:uncharacterized membrane protein
MAAVQRAERAYHRSTRAFGVLMVVIGIAMVVSAVVLGAGPLSYGVVVGVLFAALGAARFYLAGPARERR